MFIFIILFVWQTYYANETFTPPLSTWIDNSAYPEKRFLSFSAGEKIVIERLASKLGYGLTIPIGKQQAVFVLMEHFRLP
jgi:hypothetical protein